MSDQTAEADHQGANHPMKFQIQIDREHYTVHQEEMTGAELRRVPPAGISDDRDLWEVRPGHDDVLIGDPDTVKIHNGQRFFTAPRHINPGSGA